MENISLSVRSDYIERLTTVQVGVDCIMAVPEEGQVSEILGKSASCECVSATAIESAVSLDGRVNFKLVYRTGERDIRALDYFSDFSSSIKAEVSDCEKLFAFGRVQSVDIALRSDKEIRLKAIVEIDLIGAVKRSFNAVDNPSLCRKTTMIKECSLKETAEGTFDIYEEFESGVNVDKIVLLDTDLLLSSSKIGRDCLLVSGTATANITYTSDKGICSKTLTMPFCEEIRCMGAHPDDEVYLYGCIKDAGIVLGGTEENTTLRVELTIALQCPVYQVEEREMLVDAFDTEKIVSFRKSEAKSCRKVGEWSFEERLSGSAVLGEDTPLADRVITACMAKNLSSSVKAEKGKINVEGVALATVIYEDTEGIYRSVEVELPYALSFKADGAETGGDVWVRSAICDVSASLKRSREIEVIYLLKIYAYECKRSTFDVIDKLEFQECVSLEMPALVMYMGESGEEFEIAKSLRVRPENVIKGEGEDFTLCYRQLDV